MPALPRGQFWWSHWVGLAVGGRGRTVIIIVVDATTTTIRTAIFVVPPRHHHHIPPSSSSHDAADHDLSHDVEHPIAAIAAIAAIAVIIVALFPGVVETHFS